MNYACSTHSVPARVPITGKPGQKTPEHVSHGGHQSLNARLLLLVLLLLLVVVVVVVVVVALAASE
ncbi:hypothetical protein E2C01_065619 [Portunus trituberculatus]|uniref:Uncharacterized protein n=1 Tax=Portunus trituberculatus TaxID=210409 RepID=A0A5B7HMC9_PORTR|nr:hypothetical protein [Portunus trituberculatus]